DVADRVESDTTRLNRKGDRGAACLDCDIGHAYDAQEVPWAVDLLHGIVVGARYPYLPACIDSQAAEVVENSETNSAVRACAELKEELSLVIKLVRLAMWVAVFY